MTATYDCIVLGVGGFGSGALYHLAKKGQKVLGLEQFEIPNDRGSSHGDTRIIRKAYFEHPDYVPLLLRAFDLWTELENESKRKLMHLCGLMLAGPSDGEAIPGAKLAAQQHGISIEEISLIDAEKRFPGFRFPEGSEVVFEPEAGYLEVESCVEAHVERAIARGATIQTNETVTEWSTDGTIVRVLTDRGIYQSKQLVVTAGPWATKVLSDLNLPLEVVRKPLFWNVVNDEEYRIENGAPTFYFELPNAAFYGFPSIDGETVKLADHLGGERVADPLKVDRDLHDEDLKPLSQFVRNWMPELSAKPVRHAVCMYTLTPDHHFIIDKHPKFENVIIGAGFSGHGFKFTSVLGEALADLAVEGKSELPIEFLNLSRLL